MYILEFVEVYNTLLGIIPLPEGFCNIRALREITKTLMGKRENSISYWLSKKKTKKKKKSSIQLFIRKKKLE